LGATAADSYERGGTPPQILPGSTRAVAGLDPTAGGTWFGVNEHGVLVSVTNRLKSDVPKQPRSRGMLVRELLGAPTAEAAVNQACRELGKNPYGGCNILCIDAERAVVVQAGDWLRVRPLPPGLHVLTNHDVNDGSDRRLGHALWWLSQRAYDTADDCIKALKELCG